MTVEFAYQHVREHFPEMKFTLFLDKLNRAVQEFIQETDCVIASVKGTVSGTTITITSPASQTLTNQGNGNQMLYNIPTFVYAVHEIRFADSQGAYLDSPVRYLIDVNTIEFFNTEGEPLNEWPSDVYYIEFVSTKAPTALSATTDSIAIPDTFCEGVIAKILSDMYASGGKNAILQLAGWWREEFLRVRRAAKRFGNWQRDRTMQRGVVGELMAADGNTSIYGEPTVMTETNYDGGAF